MKPSLFLLLILMLTSGLCPGQNKPDSVYEREGLNHLMGLLNLQLTDIAFRDDYTRIDSFRLQAVSDLMSHPYGMIGYTETFRDRCRDGDLKSITTLAFEALKKTNQGSRQTSAIGTEQARLQNTFYNSMELNQFLGRAYDYLYHNFPDARAAMLEKLSSEEVDFLLHEFREILLEDTADENKTAEMIDSISQVEEEYVKRFAEFGYKIRKDYAVYSGIEAALTFYDLAVEFKDRIARGQFDPAGVLADTIFLPNITGARDYLGRQEGWAVGGPGNDHYAGDYRFIIDFGGDDRYDLANDSLHPHDAIIIDLAGDDIYNSQNSFTLGSGCLGTGLLFDLGGDDVYNGGNFSCGSGYFGFGLLYDESGHDRYFGDTHAQGAGTAGAGLLIDRGGSDVYSAAIFSQGFAGAEGFGLICDLLGNDNYIAGNKYKDILRYDNHYLSLSQGFAYGLRPYLSGGIGAIVDYKGNDNYVSDIFGQGASYWWALGMIYDSSGNDQYLSYQYAQGSATHMTVGILFDDYGDDFYRGKGLMQGCGHDYSCGLCLDRHGSDIYQADDLSQAAGSANGIGILIDSRGDDAYYVLHTHNTQGYGNPRRDFGSMGLFLDLGGNDQYRGNGLENSYWKTPSKWGGGFDREYIVVDTTANGNGGTE